MRFISKLKDFGKKTVNVLKTFRNMFFNCETRINNYNVIYSRIIIGSTIFITGITLFVIIVG